MPMPPAWGLGTYLVASGLTVRRNANPDSEVVLNLVPGVEVEVVQVLDYMKTHGVVMGRIAEPEGWIPLRDTDGECFAQKQQTPLHLRTTSPSGKKDSLAPEPIRTLEGEWRPYTRQGMRSPSLVKIDEQGQVTFDGVRTPAQDLAMAGTAITRKDGWILNADVSKDNEVLWCKAGGHGVLWKRVTSYSEFSIGDTVEWTSQNKDVPPGTMGEVVGVIDGSIRVKFPKLTVDAAASELVPTEAIDRDEQGRTMLEILQGEWRLYDGLVRFPGLVVIGVNGHALYNGGHWPEQDLVVLGGSLVRGDGWSVKMESSSSHELLWSRTGEPSITWRRVKPATDYLVGEKVRWTEESQDVPTGTVGEVVALMVSTVQVMFGTVTMNLPPAELLALTDERPESPKPPKSPKSQKSPGRELSLEGAAVEAHANSPTSRSAHSASSPTEAKAEGQLLLDSSASPKGTAAAKSMLLRLTFEDDRSGGSNANLESKRPPPLQTEFDTIDEEKPVQIPSAAIPWGKSPMHQDEESPAVAEHVSEDPQTASPQARARAVREAIATSSIALISPTAQHQQAASFAAGLPTPRAGSIVTPTNIPVWGHASSSSTPSAGTAEMVMVFAPGSEHPILYQQVTSPAQTPSTGTPPLSPGFLPKGSKGFPPLSPNSQLLQQAEQAHLQLQQQEQQQHQQPPDIVQEGEEQRQAQPLGAPPGAKAVTATSSGRGSGRWGSGWMQALTGPIGSSMSGISSRVRGSGAPEHLAVDEKGRPVLEDHLASGSTLGASASEIPHTPSPHGSNLYAGSTGAETLRIESDRPAEVSVTPTPLVQKPVAKMDPEKRRQILV